MRWHSWLRHCATSRKVKCTKYEIIMVFYLQHERLTQECRISPTIPKKKSFEYNHLQINSLFTGHVGASDDAVGWGTPLQARRSRVQFPIVSLEFFYWHNTSGCTTALELTQPLMEMSTRNISCGVKAAGAYSWQPYHLRVPTILKSGSLNLLEPSGPRLVMGMLYRLQAT